MIPKIHHKETEKRPEREKKRVKRMKKLSFEVVIILQKIKNESWGVVEFVLIIHITDHCLRVCMNEYEAYYSILNSICIYCIYFFYNNRNHTIQVANYN